MEKNTESKLDLLEEILFSNLLMFFSNTLIKNSTMHLIF